MYENILIFILVIIIIIVSLFYTSTYNRIPKKIWTYSEHPRSKVLDMCIANWIELNPGYEVVVLTRKTYKGYITIPVDILMHPNFHDSATRFSELVRLWTLAEHGGIWMDLVRMNEPLDKWLFPKYGEFSGYMHNGILPSLMACNKNSSFMKAWRDEFSTIVHYQNVEEYIKNKANTETSAIQIAGDIAMKMSDSLILRKAVDGPYKYLVDCKWNSNKAVLIQERYPLVIFREEERRALEKR